MTIDERDDRNRADIEGALGRLVPQATPPRLGGRVLGAALEARKNAVLTPRMRIAAVACAILIVAVLGADRLVGRRQAAQMATLLDGPGVSNLAGQDVAALWAELGADLGDSDRFQRVGIALSRLKERDGPRKVMLEQRDQLKGMIDHEIPEDIF
jgi:hypothetical protein